MKMRETMLLEFLEAQAVIGTDLLQWDGICRSQVLHNVESIVVFILDTASVIPLSETSM